MNRIVLFGGSGFVGSALRTGLPAPDLIVAPTHAEVDLLDPDAVRGVLAPGDVVVNAAGYASATDRTDAGRARLRRTNVEAVGVLAEAATTVGASRLIHLSSVAAMGQRTGSGLREHDLAEPRSPYGRSKLDAELLLSAYGTRLPITILRPTSIFGPGRGLAVLLGRVARLPVIPLPGGGRAEIPFSHIDNLVGAVAATIASPSTTNGRTFIVGDPTSYPLRSILVGLAIAQGRRRPRTIYVPIAALRVAGAIEGRVAAWRRRTPLLDPVRLDTLTVSVSYSTDAFREATGFVPPVGLREALHALVGPPGLRADS